MANLVTQPPNGIQRRTHESWCIGIEHIVEEVAGDRYNVIDNFRLDIQGLRRLHSVLGQVLADLDADPFEGAALFDGVEPKPEF